MDTDDIGGLADLLSDSRARGVGGGAVGCGIVHSKSPVNEKCPVTVHHRGGVGMREQGKAATLRYL